MHENSLTTPCLILSDGLTLGMWPRGERAKGRADRGKASLNSPSPRLASLARLMLLRGGQWNERNKRTVGSDVPVQRWSEKQQNEIRENEALIATVHGC